MKTIAFSEIAWPESLLKLIKSVHIPVSTETKKLADVKLAWDFCLFLDRDGVLALIDKKGRALKIDFDHDPAYHRKRISKKNDPLLKALGIAAGRERVWDVSAGLGRDAVMMASCGLQVTCFERNPALFVLLSYAAEKSVFLQELRIRFHFQDAVEAIKNLPKPFPANGVIYFDPMYPPKKKSALPPQEMVILKELVGIDSDAEQVIKQVTKIHGVRLVVKRPDSAPTLPGFGHSILGKMVRFDVFTSV